MSSKKFACAYAVGDIKVVKTNIFNYIDSVQEKLRLHPGFTEGLECDSAAKFWWRVG